MIDIPRPRPDQLPLGDFQRFGIMGGSFNPIHIGHISIAQQVMNKLKLQRVFLMPAALAPHKQKDPEMASAKDRMAMCKLAVEHMRGLSASPYELDRGGVSYTIETARALRAAYGEDTEIRFLIGSDSLVELHTWKEIDALLELIDFAIADRKDHTLDPSIWPGIREALGESAEKKLRASVVPVERVDISSTQIRALVMKGHSLRGLLRHGVEDYIRKHGLYNCPKD